MTCWKQKSELSTILFFYIFLHKPILDWEEHFSNTFLDRNELSRHSGTGKIYLYPSTLPARLKLLFAGTITKNNNHRSYKKPKIPKSEWNMHRSVVQLLSFYPYSDMCTCTKAQFHRTYNQDPLSTINKATGNRCTREWGHSTAWTDYRHIK